MILGRVLGNMVSVCKWETLNGSKLLLVEPIDDELNTLGPIFIAVDTVGAGENDVVLIIESREATNAFNEPNTPTDMGIVGIIDEILSGGKIHKIR